MYDILQRLPPFHTHTHTHTQTHAYIYSHTQYTLTWPSPSRAHLTHFLAADGRRNPYYAYLLLIFTAQFAFQFYYS